MAAISRRDRHHAVRRQLFEAHVDAALIVPITVACRGRLPHPLMVSPASGARVPDRPGQGLYLLEPVGPEVLARARTVDARYADANLGLVDSSVIAVAERLNADAIATLNHDDLRLASQGCWPLLPPP